MSAGTKCQISFKDENAILGIINMSGIELKKLFCLSGGKYLMKAGRLDVAVI